MSVRVPISPVLAADWPHALNAPLSSREAPPFSALLHQQTGLQRSTTCAPSLRVPRENSSFSFFVNLLSLQSMSCLLFFPFHQICSFCSQSRSLQTSIRFTQILNLRMVSLNLRSTQNPPLTLRETHAPRTLKVHRPQDFRSTHKPFLKILSF